MLLLVFLTSLILYSVHNLLVSIHGRREVSKYMNSKNRLHDVERLLTPIIRKLTSPNYNFVLVREFNKDSYGCTYKTGISSRMAVIYVKDRLLNIHIRAIFHEYGHVRTWWLDEILHSSLYLISVSTIVYFGVVGLILLPVIFTLHVQLWIKLCEWVAFRYEKMLFRKWIYYHKIGGGVGHATHIQSQ